MSTKRESDKPVGAIAQLWADKRRKATASTTPAPKAATGTTTPQTGAIAALWRRPEPEPNVAREVYEHHLAAIRAGFAPFRHSPRGRCGKIVFMANDPSPRPRPNPVIGASRHR